MHFLIFGSIKKNELKENYLLTQLILRLLLNNFFFKIESKENYLLTQLILKLLIIFLKILKKNYFSKNINFETNRNLPQVATRMEKEMTVMIQGST